jgi:hypothetical protein
MTFQEQEQIKLKRQSSKEAIALAMQGRWREAIAANISIIDNFPNDVDAHNRLGRAYMELGEYPQAREAYSRALELDPYNIIAKKNLHRLSQLGEPVTSSESSPRTADPRSFIEEVGKAGVLTLRNPAPAPVLARMVAGEKVILKIEGGSLFVENSRGERLGEVDYRHAQRLIKLMEGGNQYAAAIVSSNENAVTVIIRETYQHPGQVGYLSFPPKGGEPARTYGSDRIFKRELEFEDTASEDTGFTLIDEEGTETPLKESPDESRDDGIEDEE